MCLDKVSFFYEHYYPVLAVALFFFSWVRLSLLGFDFLVAHDMTNHMAGKIESFISIYYYGSF
jgi:hypothetical protein